MMLSEKQYQEKKDWFNENFVANPCGVLGNCSACVFRNAKQYCAKMSCSYSDYNDNIETVYWTQKYGYGIIGWPSLAQWFESTPVTDVLNISEDAIRTAIIKQQRGK